MFTTTAQVPVSQACNCGSSTCGCGATANPASANARSSTQSHPSGASLNVNVVGGAFYDRCWSLGMKLYAAVVKDKPPRDGNLRETDGRAKATSAVAQLIFGRHVLRNITQLWPRSFCTLRLLNHTSTAAPELARPLPGLEPIFPPELEREIFELSALLDSRVIPRLILVAHRVRIWIEPLLYRVISVEALSLIYHTMAKRQIPEDILLAALESKPMSIWRDHTRHLYVGLPAGENMTRILSMCSRISDLALFRANYEPPFQYSKFLPLMAAMPLVRLSTYLRALFYHERVDFSHPIFTHITHLNLLDTRAGDWWPEGLGRLPCLTHISFDFPSSPYPSGLHDHFLRDVFAHCALLEVFIFRCRNDDEVRGNLPYYTYLADEPRSVLLGVYNLLEDWQIGAEGGVDYWVRAERFIKQRQSGEISVRDYAIFHQGSDNGEPHDANLVRVVTSQEETVGYLLDLVGDSIMCYALYCEV
ncbi:hypothetical protein B0H11DRAFT_2293343 [Mycena galericulata]|nr:hypothetical protein B0H11DRAFT_2293343 [Mycena galericulata]